MRTLPFEYAVRNLGRSHTRLALSVLGSALVVTLVIAAAAFVNGMEKSLRASGNPHNALILGAGSEESVERSEIEASIPSLLAASIPGIRETAGVAHISPEVHTMLPVAAAVNVDHVPLVMIRGITPAATLVHDTIQITDGRLPASGQDEVLLGATTHIKMGIAAESIAIGNSIYIDNRPWTIVGHFVAPGTVMDAEIWADLLALKSATKRETISCAIVTLDPARVEMADVIAFTKMRVDLELSAMSEAEYYASLAAFFAPIRAVAWITAALIGLGGLFGGLNTMYAAFASRVREIGTLQSLGFRRFAIILSLIQESTLATAAGALIACAFAFLFLDNLCVRFSMGVFGLTIDSPVIALALTIGLALGIIGALPPAWRCLRLSIPVALKSI